MSYISNPAAVLFLAALFLAGCAGAPADTSDAAGSKGRGSEVAAPPPSPPPRPSIAPPAPRPPAPDQSAEGMTVYELQERLAKLGYKPGTVDGISGPRTVEALKKYQADSKIPVTGNVDPDTIRKLRSEKMP